MASLRSDVRNYWHLRQRDFRLLKWLLCSAASVHLLVVPARAAQWEIVPSMALQERYTDNVALQSDEAKQSDWVTELVPAVSVAATGARLRFRGTYEPQALYYAGGSYDNDIYQRGNALGTAELAEKLVFVDFGGRLDQYNVSLQGPQASSNINNTGNRATVGSYFVSPYLRGDFGSMAQAEARFTGSLVDSDDTSLLANSVADRLDLRLNSGPAYKVFTWNVDYAKENISYDDEGNDISSDVVGAHAKRLITPSVGMLVSAAYDRYRIGSPPESLEGEAWSAGLDWVPSTRTRFAATAGRRFYGDDYMLDVMHRTRLATFNVGYNQIITTTRSEFFAVDNAAMAGYLNTLFAGQFVDPVAREKAVQEYMARTAVPPGLNGPTNFFSSALFLAKRWQASAALLGVRNILIANVFQENRDVLGQGNPVVTTADDFEESESVNQLGTSFQWTLRFTGQDTWNLSAGYSRSEFQDTAREDRLKYVSMGLSRQFEPRLVGSLNYRWQDNDSNDGVSDYTENAVFATVQKRF